jgi:hypothetical protein
MRKTAFDYDAYPGGYSDRVRELVQRKADGLAPVTLEEPKTRCRPDERVGRQPWKGRGGGNHARNRDADPQSIQRIADVLEQVVEILERLVKAGGEKKEAENRD